ncbi:MAG: hypothetical protein H6559_26510 [Lewinellaceae bacterium]|nr:hypothetical protein [Lewinellaceae bacterium]
MGAAQVHKSNGKDKQVVQADTPHGVGPGHRPGGLGVQQLQQEVAEPNDGEQNGVVLQKGPVRASDFLENEAQHAKGQDQVDAQAPGQRHVPAHSRRQEGKHQSQQQPGPWPADDSGSQHHHKRQAGGRQGHAQFQAAE